MSMLFTTRVHATSNFSFVTGVSTRTQLSTHVPSLSLQESIEWTTALLRWRRTRNVPGFTFVHLPSCTTQTCARFPWSQICRSTRSEGESVSGREALHDPSAERGRFPLLFEKLVQPAKARAVIAAKNQILQFTRVPLVAANT